jgi:hypothetical protein
MKRDKNKSILTEVISMRISKEDKLIIRNLQDKYYFDVFQFVRDAIRSEYFKRTNANI